MGEPTTVLHTLSVDPSQAGTRLDRWLAMMLPALSRSRLQALIAEGHAHGSAGLLTDASRKVKAGETVRLDVPPDRPAWPTPEPIGLTIVYEDTHLIVIDKPAGMVVHPAAGNMESTLVNALLHHCAGTLSGIGGITRPGIVHRLDKDTSGLIVVAKSDAAHKGLAEQFAAHSIHRAYRAVCWGVPLPRQGEIAGNIGRSPADRKKMAIVGDAGKPALTRYRVVRAFGTVAAAIECRLATGRTHQIRVHMASIGHPLIGDPLYGAGQRARKKSLDAERHAGLSSFPRQALHAFLLGFCHPGTGEWLEFQSVTPHDINRLMSSLEIL